MCKKLRSLISLLTFFSYSLFAQTSPKVTVHINPEIGPNSSTKSGYNLIFADEFNVTIQNDHIWHFSDTDEIGATCQEYADHPEDYPATGYLTTIYPPPDTNNVTSTGQEAKIYVKGAYFNTCDHSGGEIKTVDIQAQPNPPYRNWQLLPNSYLEIRAKLPFLPNKNIGSAGWLFAEWTSPEYREIDIWENFGDKNDRFQNNYYSGTTGATKVQDPCKIVIRDLDNNKVFIDKQFLIYGVEWTDSIIKFYLNNVLIRTINLSVTTPEKLPPLPFTLRLGTGRALNVEPNLNIGESAFLLVDYVRLFKKNNTLATQPHGIPTSGLCTNGNGYIGVWYVNGAQYTWTSPSFDIIHTGSQFCFCDEIMIFPKSGITPNINHHVHLDITYATGYTESVTYPVFVGSTPLPPTGINTALYNNTCDYQLTAVGGSTLVPSQWRINGNDWSSSAASDFCCLEAGNYTIEVEREGNCGASTVYTNNVNLPFVTGCAHLAPSSPDEISEDLVKVNDIFETKESDISETIDCEIYTLMGVLIWKGFIGRPYWETLKYNILSLYPTGIYVVRINEKIPKVIKIFSGN